MDFKDRVVVVTGAGGGVGQQLVLQLLKEGAFVAAVDINLDALEKTKERVLDKSANVSIHVADITDRKRVCELSIEVNRQYGHIDILINNAGIIQPFCTLFDLEMEVIERVININFFGMLNMTRTFLPYLAAQGKGYIGNVSSMGGFLPVPGQSIYGASKAAVKIATEALRMELSETDIGVSLIIPGGIETDIKKNSGLKEVNNVEDEKKSSGIKLTSPEKAAETIIQGIKKEKAKILIGSDSALMDLLYRVMPQKAGKLISKVMSKNHGGIFNKTNDLRSKKCKKKCV